MICEKCQQRQATVHMQQTINGWKTETYLCQECASHSDPHISPPLEQIFQGLMAAFAAPHIHQQASGDLQARQDYKCPSCGLTYVAFRNAGKIGCAECYVTFRTQMDAILKNIHASAQHQGKFPRKTGQNMMLRRKAEHLRLSLAKAVENEQYEDAARIRDQIKEIEAVDI